MWTKRDGGEGVGEVARLRMLRRGAGGEDVLITTASFEDEEEEVDEDGSTTIGSLAPSPFVLPSLLPSFSLLLHSLCTLLSSFPRRKKGKRRRILLPFSRFISSFNSLPFLGPTAWEWVKKNERTEGGDDGDERVTKAQASRKVKKQD